ncbi:MAG: 4Fe-4S binding protein [Rectinemataceae bacterium]|nr:4Fe-4S binding protein [Rectinemataceae bacterium]
MSEQKKVYFHLVRERYCKGCGICVSFCPKQVLVLKNGKVFPERPELCIGCRMCELRCPDYAIEIHEKVDEKEQGHDAACVDYAVPPEAQHG